MALKRLKKDLIEFQKNDFSFLSAGPKDDDFHHWEGMILGLADTPYEGGTFLLDIYFPTNYPIDPPVIHFKTRIYHPNINANGAISVDILKQQWSPALTVEKVLLSLCSFIYDPNPLNPLVPEIAKVYLQDPELFRKNAAEWTRKYAT